MPTYPDDTAARLDRGARWQAEAAEYGDPEDHRRSQVTGLPARPGTRNGRCFQ